MSLKVKNVCLQKLNTDLEIIIEENLKPGHEVTKVNFAIYIY